MSSGIKSFEYRRNDRDFKVGDLLLLREWDPTQERNDTFIPESCRYTGRKLLAEVMFIVYGGQFGVPEGYCVMSVKIRD